MSFGKKVASIREIEGLTRPDLNQLVDIPLSTLGKIERDEREPGVYAVQKICKAFPQYTLWLMTDQVNPEAGQISPEIKKAQQDYQAQEVATRLQAG